MVKLYRAGFVRAMYATAGHAAHENQPCLVLLLGSTAP
jgi:hypothetical protein